MRATEEAAFVPDRLKAYALSMACEMLLKYCNQRRKLES